MEPCLGQPLSSITLEISQDCAEGRTSSSMSLFLSTPSGKGKSCCVPVLGHQLCHRAQQAPDKSSTAGTWGRQPQSNGNQLPGICLHNWERGEGQKGRLDQLVQLFLPLSRSQNI